MDILTFILLIIVGLVLGSFLNVVIFRKGTGLSLGGRSMCFSCGKTLAWYELIPLISFMIQGGKCRSCKAKLSWQYPIVEGLAAAGFTWLGYLWLIDGGLSWIHLGFFVLSSSVCFSLLAIASYDLRHMIIPDSFSFWFTLSSLALVGLSYLSFRIDALSFGRIMDGKTAIMFIATGIVFAFVFFLVWLLSRGKWIGFGDAKLVLGIGFFLGPVGGVSAIVYAFWVGALYAIFHMIRSAVRVRRGRSALSHEVPFAPFLIVGIIIAYIVPVDLMRVSFIIDYVTQVFFS